MKKFILILILITGISYTQDYCLKFDGTDDLIYFGDNSSLDINGKNSTGLTVEMWLFISTPSNAALYGRGSDNGGLLLYLQQNYFKAGVNTPQSITIQSQQQLPCNQWLHLAFQITNTTASLYLNGNLLTLSCDGQVKMPATCQTGGIVGGITLYLGGIIPIPLYLNGKIDELRVSNTIRYTTNFIPSRKVFTDDENTRLLWHFNEGQDVYLLDWSGNGNTGLTVNGPVWQPGYFSTIDNIAPGKVNTLMAEEGIQPGSIKLTWQSTGDDGYSGNLEGYYLIQYSTFTPQWNIYNSQISIYAENVLPGTLMSYTLDGLISGTVYNFCLWTCDEVLNFSPQSNIVSCSAKAGASNPPLKPFDLRCDGMQNPLNLSNFTPNLSWVFSDNDPGNIQMAYRILVSNSQTLLDSNTGNIWDTGKVLSQNQSVLYSGKPLQYGATYYWKVMTWDNTDTPGGYSDNAFFIMKSSVTLLGSFKHPYGVNSWMWPIEGCQAFSNVHMDRYRIMVDWASNEPYDNSYNWSSSLHDAIDNAYTLGAKLSLCVYMSPQWARSNKSKELSYSPQKYAEFLTALLQHCQARKPNIVEAVEIENEWPTGLWNDSVSVTKNTDQRDPSWYYAEILKAGYNAVKNFNPNILVVMDGIWFGAYHHLDELYQLGCKGYFDRINFHHYVQDFGAPEDPAYRGSTWHFPTTLRYLKYIAEQNNDANKLIWLTEFGWRISDEKKKSDYMRYILDTCRKSGFTELASMYVGLAGGYPNHDKIGLIYTDKDWDPSFLIYTTAYYMYQDFTNQYPAWDLNLTIPLDTLQPATQNINIINPGFETGNTTGWDAIGIIDSSVKHSGNFSMKQTAPNNIRTIFYPAQPDRLYEVIAWVKVDAINSDACMLNTRIIQRYNGGNSTVYDPPNYFGIVDTRNYPGSWRRIRYMYLVPQNINEIALEFYCDGNGTYWVDDVSINALNFSQTQPGTQPLISVNPLSLLFENLLPNESKTLSFTITNAGEGVLSGEITTDSDWLTIQPVEFYGNSVTVNVTADNEILNEKEGTHTGKILVNSNGGDVEINVEITATCILTKPNPYNPEKGKLKFFGNGIVKNVTRLKIWTLSGELIWETTDTEAFSGDEIIWNGINKTGEKVVPGIYIYTYESPKEKGTGKFTVIK